jgi:SAM-dependent methyltransferase
MNNKNINEKSLEYYESALKKYGDTALGVNWKSEESQNLRFSVLAKIGNLENKSLHDVGCGTARLKDFLEKYYPGCSYIGSDISALMIDAAKKRIGPGSDLIVGDILTKSSKWMEADYLINSGIFTVKQEIKDEDWRSFVYLMIERMFNLASKGIGFNLMSSYVDYKDNNLYYASPHEIIDFCVKNLSRKICIHHDYNLYEFTTFVYK